MKKINLAAVPVQEAHSPKGRFRHFSQDLLTAMRQTNGDRMTNVRFPFDIKLVSLPPRAANGPYRSHSARWVYYQIITGRGVVRTIGTPLASGSTRTAPRRPFATSSSRTEAIRSSKEGAAVIGRHDRKSLVTSWDPGLCSRLRSC